MYKFLVRNTDIAKIANSGQCFSIFSFDSEFYYVLSRDFLCLAYQKDSDIVVECKESQSEYWERYFDVNNSVYEKFLSVCIKESHPFLKNAIAYGKGLRILNQDPFECLISFIISQRKSIPAITTSISQLSMKYGQFKEFMGVQFYSFPSPQELVIGYKKDGYADCGLGYRDNYVYETSKQMVSEEPILQKLKYFSYNSSMSYLLKLKGVGEKVANCVCLYSLAKIDAFPIDVWMNRVLNQFFTTEELVKMSIQYEGMKGLLQLYMFYYGRNNL